MDLPAQLLHCLEERTGSVALVLGAGCSMEPPTRLKSASEYAREVHRKLVRQGVLTDGDCTDHEDLSAVADAVVHARGDQRELVERLPLEDFRNAEPNKGYLIAVALLIERRISSILTLNFDLALDTALQKLRVRELPSEVAVVHGPQFHSRLESISLIYLHGTVNDSSENWILTTDKLSAADDGWRKIVTERVAGVPVTVFAGLGTPVEVMIESVRRMQDELGDETSVFQVDRVDPQDSKFFAALGISEDQYLQGRWVEFAEEMGKCILQLQIREVVESFERLLETEDWQVADLGDLEEQLSARGLVFFGLARGAWLGKHGYLPWHALNESWLAELLLAVRFLEVQGCVEGSLRRNGTVEFESAERGPSSVRLLHGEGRRWSLVALPSYQPVGERILEEEPFTIIATGGSGPDPTESAAPEKLVANSDSEDLIDGAITLRFFTLDQLRDCPELMEEILG